MQDTEKLAQSVFKPFVRPGKRMTPRATEVTGITDQFLAQFEPFPKVRCGCLCLTSELCKCCVLWLREGEAVGGVLTPHKHHAPLTTRLQVWPTFIDWLNKERRGRPVVLVAHNGGSSLAGHPSCARHSRLPDCITFQLDPAASDPQVRTLPVIQSFCSQVRPTEGGSRLAQVRRWRAHTTVRDACETLVVAGDG
jgi:hypothetical protein